MRAGVLGLLRSGELGLQAAHGIEHLYGGIVPGGAEFARERDVAVEDGAHGVADGLVEIVAFHEDGEESGDGAAFRSCRRVRRLSAAG